nr:WYL domain-containing protein [Streptomyces sp. SAJ15]
MRRLRDQDGEWCDSRLAEHGREVVLNEETVRAVDSIATAVGDDGWVEALILAENTEHACGELMRLGIDVEVVALAELRQAMAAIVGVPPSTRTPLTPGKAHPPVRPGRGAVHQDAWQSTGWMCGQVDLPQPQATSIEARPRRQPASKLASFRVSRGNEHPCHRREGLRPYDTSTSPKD